MAEYGSKYTFRIDIEGHEAVERAKKLRRQLATVLEAQLQPTVELTKALETQEVVLESINTSITSQTRRLSYNIKRQAEAAASVDKLVTSLAALDKGLEEIGEAAFVGLVKSAQDAYNQIVGQSIIPELSARTIAYLDAMREAGEHAFDPFEESAESAGGGVDVLLGRIHKLQEFLQGMVAGTPLFALLDKFVDISKIEPIIGGIGPEGGLEATAGVYIKALREIRVALAALVKEEATFFDTQELLEVSLHELGHAFSDLAGRIAPVEAQLARAEYAVAAAEAIRMVALVRRLPIAEAAGEAFADQFADAFIHGIEKAGPAFASAFRTMMGGIRQELVKYTPQMWKDLLEFGPAGMSFKQLIGAPGPAGFLAQLGTTALIPQLAQVRDLVIQTAEVAPGVFVPISDGAQVAADRTKLLDNVTRELVQRYETLQARAAGAGEEIKLLADPLTKLPPGATQLVLAGFGVGLPPTVPPPPPPVPPSYAQLPLPLPEVPVTVDAATSAMERFNIAVNEATIQYFGLRRLGYGLESVGTSMREMSRATIGALKEASEGYYEFSAAATRAGIAMELQADLFPVLESRILDTSIALGLFAPEDVAEGLRLWTAGTGAVVRTEKDLNEVLAQTVDIQKLAVLNAVELGETTTNVGAIMAEYDLRLDQTRRTTEVLNFVAAKTFANVNDVGQAFRFVGPLAKEAGDSFEVGAAALALAADAGLRGSHAGRALRQMYIQLLDPTEKHNEAMNDALGLSEDLRESWTDIVFPEGEFIGLAKYIDLLAAATENYTEQQRLELLATISTANELPLLVSLVSQQIEGRKENINVLRAYAKIIQGVTDEETARYTQFVEQQTGMVFTVESATSLMRQQWEMLGQDVSFEVWQLEQRVNAAMTRVGQVASESLLPLQRIQTAIIEEFSEFIAKYPGAAEAMAGIGLFTGGLATLFSLGGKIAGAAANILIMAYVAKEFGLSTSVFSFAVKEFAAAAGAKGVGGLTVAGVIAAIARVAGPALALLLTGAAPVYETRVRATQERVVIIQEKLARSEELTAEEAARLTTELEQLTGWLRSVGEAVGGMTARGIAAWGARYAGMAAAGYGVVPGLMQVPGGVGITKAQREALGRWEEYLDDRNELVARYDERLETLRERHLQAQGKAHDTYLRNRDTAIENYHFREERLEEDHQRSLAKIRERYEQNVARIHERYAEAIARAEEQRQERLERYMEDYHKRMERMRLDHIWRMEDLIRTRDARGLLLEMRSHRRKVREAKEDRDDWIRRQREDAERQRREAAEARDKALEQARKDFEKALQEQREQFERQRERREEDFQRRLDEMLENYERQAAERAQQYEDDKQDLIDAKAEELDELARAAALELEEILDLIEDTEREEADSYERRLTALEEFLKERRRLMALYEWHDGRPPWSDPGRPPPRQYGGYAFGGLYRVGEAGREFILDYPTTRAMEGFVGPLSQRRLVEAFSARGVRGGGFVIEVNQAYWTFQGSFTEKEKLWFQETARQSAYEAVGDVAAEVMGT